MTEVPATARKPQDRKPKAEDAPTVTTVAVRGIDVTVPADALDDFELLDDLHELENGNATRLPAVLRRLVGDQWRAVMDVARDPETGRVSIESGAEVVREIMAGLAPNS